MSAASAASADRRTYLLVDGENIDATLGTSILGRRPQPEEPRWDRLLDFFAVTALSPGGLQAVLPRGQRRAAHAVRPGAVGSASAPVGRQRPEGRRHRHPAHHPRRSTTAPTT
ncbi:MAG: hypothetical protein R2734_03400 [Nocardioides sp.]